MFENAAVRKMFLLFRFFKWIRLFQMDIPFSNGHVHLKKGCPFEKGADTPKKNIKKTYIYLCFWAGLPASQPACRPASLSVCRPAGRPELNVVRPLGLGGVAVSSLFQMDTPFSNGHVHLKKGCPFEKGKSAGWPAGRLAGRQAGWLAGVFKANNCRFFRSRKT